MRRKLVFFLITTSIIILIVLLVNKIFNQSPKQGVLKVEANVQSTIYIENNSIGKTPFEGKVNSGEFTIRVVPDSTVQNMASWQGKVLIGQNLLTYINRDLTQSELTNAGEVLWLEKITSKTSEVAISTTPDGSNIQLDDQESGISPKLYDNISPGDHIITIASPGFLTRTLKIKSTQGYKLNAVVNLGLDPTSATNEITPTPETAIQAETSITPSISETPSISITKALTPTPTLSVTPKTTTKSQQTPKSPYITILDTPTGFLRVREQAATSSKEIGKVNPDEQYSIIQEQKSGGVTWYQIAFDGEQEGWVSGTYAKKTE